MDSIEIQKVSADDLMEIRHLVLWPDKPREFVKVPEDESGIHFGLYFEGALVSVISLFGDAQCIRFRKFATLPALQGKGLGSRLLQHAIMYAQTEATRACGATPAPRPSDFTNGLVLGNSPNPFSKSISSITKSSGCFETNLY